MSSGLPRTSLAWRVTAGCLLVAVVAVLVAALVTLRLVSQTGREVTREVLADQADVIAAQLSDTTAPVRLAGVRQVVAVLRGQGIAVVALGDDRLGAGDAQARAVLAKAGLTGPLAAPRSVTVAQGGETWLVEARPTPGGGFALLRSAETGPVAAGQLRRNLGFSLLAGAGVAIVVGAVVGGLLARPLRRTAAAAHVLRTGRRDVRVPVRGPSEVAEVAGAVNELADALTRSEGRQRAFLLSVSHELRTPLTAVRGFAESLADGVVTGDEARAAGRTIEREAQRLDRLVGDLMELARLEADDFRLDLLPVDLGALVAEAAPVWAERCRATGAELRVERPGAPVTVYADPRRLRQVLDGLAENALRITPPGAPLVLAARAPGVLEVRDGGPGLAPEDYAIVFERGALHERYRGHRPVGAGGVGLALVHALVTRMGGTIAASRAPESGAAFTIALPTQRVMEP
ncbi:HAMP domain-containing sensor histidine kinase [Pseudonocardia ailaonensis]|uniref:Signal transduction histidine-protein kinase/phosphatase MprB n=1 Tax=Pseudonocardia ailaonensis TaxID=367279 RepID=A0ABN2NDD9_9PSEU